MPAHFRYGRGKRIRRLHSKITVLCLTLMAHCSGLVLRASPFTEKEGSGAPLLLKLFCWNAINVMRFYVVLHLLMLCGGDMSTLTTATWAARTTYHALLLNMVVVHACILLPCTQNLHIHVPRISGEKNNSSNGGAPDPSSFVKGLAHETSSG